MSVKEALQPLFDWLLDGVEGTREAAVVFGRVGRDLRAAGIPLQRMAVYLRTLHPHVAGRRFAWVPGLDVAETHDLPWGDLQSERFRASPLAPVFAKGVEVRQRLGGTAPLPYVTLEELRKAGNTDYVAMPLRFISSALNAITFSTNAASGFTEEHLAALRWIARPLARVAETLGMIRTAMNLLDTYVGRNAGGRILEGKIQRGDIEAIRCVVWFSDLRGFTTLSGQKSPPETIAILNDLFECQVPAIEGQGGEVLKFIGDGLLAIFAIDAVRSPVAAANAAAEACARTFAALAKLNAGRAEPLRFGVGLHIGEVAYGNVGGANRLDFTAIGAAVNIASRIEGLTGKLGKNVLVSEAVAQLLTSKTLLAGNFELKGVLDKHNVYELSGS